MVIKHSMSISRHSEQLKPSDIASHVKYSMVDAKNGAVL